jgi:Tfp pilus assembly protein PilP
MKTRASLALALGLTGLLVVAVSAQERKQEPPAEKTRAAAVSSQDLLRQQPFQYDPAGRRDPFRDLLAGRDLTEKAGEGLSVMSIADIVLIGITKYKDQFTAIINGPDGFPVKVSVGNRFEDGFVLSISETKVVFRQTKERGVPMFRPKDITKEINPEER